MSEWEQRFKSFMLQYVQDEHDVEATEIYSIDQEAEYGGCDTCGHGSEGPTVTINYAAGEDYRRIEFPGDFARIFGL